jgi:hypothetical protein
LGDGQLLEHVVEALALPLSLGAGLLFAGLAFAQGRFHGGAGLVGRIGEAGNEHDKSTRCLFHRAA